MASSSPFEAAITWRIKDRPDMTMVELVGELTEASDLAPLMPRLKGKVVLNLAGVRRVNSTGVRVWMTFMREMTRVHEATLTHCSAAIVAQLNMIFNFRAGATVRSFMAPYICPSCDREDDKLLDVRQHFPHRDYAQVPKFTCDACHSALELDEVVETYFGFLREG